MLRLKKVRINGFHSEKKEIEFEFAQDNVTIIFGENGCGKTTLLQILNAVFAKNEEVLLNYKVNTINITFEQNGIEKNVEISQFAQEKTDQHNSDGLTELKDEAGQLLIETASHQGEYARIKRFMKECYDWTQLYSLDVQRTLLLGIDRVNIVTTVPPSVIYNFINMNKMGAQFFETYDNTAKRKFSEQLSEYITFYRKRQSRRVEIDLSLSHLVLNGNNMDVENIETAIVNNFTAIVNKASQNIQRALFLSLSQVISNKEDWDKQNELEIVTTRLEQLLPFISYVIGEIPEDSGIGEIWKLIKQENATIIIDKCKNNDRLCLIVFNIINSIEGQWEAYHSIVQLKKCFNEYTRKDKQMKIEKKGIIFEIYGDDGQVIERHRVDGLSSGEKQLLILLACLFIDGKSRDFIFIDEPDLSLNMKWQRELVALFRQYCPDTQVIMATHSPSIAEKCTECLRKLV